MAKRVIFMFLNVIVVFLHLFENPIKGFQDHPFRPLDAPLQAPRQAQGTAKSGLNITA
jgi:hypothetical protein